MYQFAYLTGALIILPIWLVLFVAKSDCRKDMVLVGLYAAVLAICLEFFWFLKDYWYPLKYISVFMLVSQESLFAFFLGGIAAAVYSQLISNKEAIALIRVLLPLVISMLSMIIFVNIIGLNSIYAN